MFIVPKRLALPALILAAVLVGLSIIHFSPSDDYGLFRDAAAVPERTTTTSQPTTAMDPITAAFAIIKILITNPGSYMCNTIKDIKNYGEGMWSYCADTTFLPKKPCLIYSFGINFDFAFDDAFGAMGCEVLSFDPSMNSPNYRHNEQVMFYNMGIGSVDNDSFVPHLDSYVTSKTHWKMRTLKSILKRMNHRERTIDILKMDIETYEWAVTRNLLETGALRRVKQFLLEWHIFSNVPPRREFPLLLTVLQDLDKVGFRLFHRQQGDQVDFFARKAADAMDKLMLCQTDGKTLFSAALRRNAEHVLRHLRAQDPAAYEVK